MMPFPLLRQFKNYTFACENRPTSCWCTIVSYRFVIAIATGLAISHRAAQSLNSLVKLCLNSLLPETVSRLMVTGQFSQQSGMQLGEIS